MEGEQAGSVELAEQVELVCGSGMHTNSLTTLLIHWNYCLHGNSFHARECGGKSETNVQPVVVQRTSGKSLQP